MESVLVLGLAGIGYLYWKQDLVSAEERDETSNQNGAIKDPSSGLVLGRSDFLGNGAYELIGPGRQYTGQVALPQQEMLDFTTNLGNVQAMAMLAADADVRADENMRKQVTDRKADLFSITGHGQYQNSLSATQFNEALDEKQGASQSRRRLVINKDLLEQTKLNQ